MCKNYFRYYNCILLTVQKIVFTRRIGILTQCADLMSTPIRTYIIYIHLERITIIN